MVEFRACPGGCVVTLLTCSGESGTRVVWIRRRIEVLLVTTDAVGRGPLEFTADVAGNALQRCVRARQCEAGGAMIEFRALPCVHG